MNVGRSKEVKSSGLYSFGQHIYALAIGLEDILAIQLGPALVHAYSSVDDVFEPFLMRSGQSASPKGSHGHFGTRRAVQRTRRRHSTPIAINPQRQERFVLILLFSAILVALLALLTLKR